MSIILGINAFHADASAALIINGKIKCAVEEERFVRIKHWAGFPSNSIKYCLNESKLSVSDVDFISINTSPWAHLPRKLLYSLSKKPKLSFLLQRFKNKNERLNIFHYMEDLFPNKKIKAKICFIEHHLAHMASTFYSSDFKNASVLSIDGFGDFSSAAWGNGCDNKLSVDKQVYFPHSLGIFYTALTQFLGFPNYGDEYKVMGLAPYGKPSYVEKIRKLLKYRKDGSFELNLKYFIHSTENIPYQWSNCEPKIGKIFSKNLINLLGPERKSNEPLNNYHMDLAHSVQFVYEESLFKILNAIYEKYENKTLCLAGGCAANSVANGKITKRTKFNRIFIQSAPGDAGGALGAALQVWHNLGNIRSQPMRNAYLGSFAKKSEINRLITRSFENGILNKEDFTLHKIGFEATKNENEFLDLIVNFLIQGKVVGLFQGRMEWGPRALGNRSIIGDPRRSDMKDILNLKIKKRESFRPFAPSVLKEEAHDWFDINSESDLEVPFMMKVLPIKKEKRKIIPAVCHVDGTGRLQTVTFEENGFYYKLIKKFHLVTNVPMILNTSFNESEPIVRTIDEAFDCFLRTKMDALVFEDTLIQRN